MTKNLILAAIFFTMFLDFFNLGLIYPIFSSLVFEGNGDLVALHSSEFYKNALFGVLISSFPFGQFLGAPLIGQLSDYYGRRHLLILSLIGTTVTLSMCACGVLFSNLFILLLGRFIGGLMAGNMTLAYASLADFSSSQEEKVKNFAWIPLATGIGFALGPYLAGLLADPALYSFAGPAIPFLFAALLSLINLGLIVWKFPETLTRQPNKKVFKNYLLSFACLANAFQKDSLRPYLWALFLMISSNLLFVQFIGPFAIHQFHLHITALGQLYANIGVAVACGHLFLTRTLAKKLSPEKASMGSLCFLSLLISFLLLSYGLVMLHILTFMIMLACAVAYTNSMVLVSNQAAKEQQGEIMGIAVSIQSCSEFLPALILGLLASVSQAIPLLAAALCATCSGLILFSYRSKLTKEVTN